MFEFDAGKLVIIGIVALIVIGPKELPRVMRQVGQAVAKLRRLGADFQAQFMDAMREADAEEMKAGVGKLAESAKIDLDFNPMALAKAEITSALETHPETGAVAKTEVAQLPAPDLAENSMAASTPAAETTEAVASVTPAAAHD